MRRHAVEPGAAIHDRHGLAVVALRGVAGWLHAFAELPAGVEGPAIDILLAMLNGHMGRALA